MSDWFAVWQYCFARLSQLFFTAIQKGITSGPAVKQKSIKEHFMIIGSFDDKSPAKINVKKNENAVSVDAVIYTVSHEIEKYVTEHYNCEIIGEYKMASGDHSVYVVNPLRLIQTIR